MLKKQFENAFEELEKGKFGYYEDVKFFGINTNDAKELISQVGILYYNSENDFSIKLKTKQDDEVILCKNPEGNNFNKIYENITNIKIKEKTEFTININIKTNASSIIFN